MLQRGRVRQEAHKERQKLKDRETEEGGGSDGRREINKKEGFGVGEKNV